MGARRIKKAVIVAAGLSSRLYPLTLTTPKSLLKVRGESLLERSVRLLRSQGVEEIGIVVGFQHDLFRSTFGRSLRLIANPFFRECNNMGSLWMARSFVGSDPFFYLHADLLYSEAMLKNALMDCDGTSVMDLIVDFGPVDEEAMKVRVDSRNHLIESNKAIHLKEAAGEWTGIALIHQPVQTYDAIEACLMAGGLKDYDTAAFTGMAAQGLELKCLPTRNEKWIEIDTAEDLARAEARFGPSVR